LPDARESADAPFNRDDWLWEPKLDGYRVLAFVTKDGVRLRSRRGLDLTPQFPKLAAELAAQNVDGMILDGELVAFDADGKPSFNALQDRASRKTPTDVALGEQSIPVVMYCFDLLHFAASTSRVLPYEERRRYLSQVPAALAAGAARARRGGRRRACTPPAIASGFEGVVGKRRDSRYEPGRRTAAWLKVKPTQTGEFVVGGYTRGKGARAPLGALIVGYHADDALQLRLARRLGIRRPHARRSHQAPVENEDRRVPVRASPEQNGVPTWVDAVARWPR
jgi:bifunctional non-homologous end joining protein LigD